jgi:hypothetical protein
VGKHLRFAVILTLLLAPVVDLMAVPPPTAAQVASSTIVAHAVDGSGNPLEGACYIVSRRQFYAIYNQPFCDADDGVSDGTASTTEVLSSQPIVLVMIMAPKGYLAGQSQPLDGQATELTFKLEKGGSTIEVTSIDAAGKPLTGACFILTAVPESGGSGPAASYACAGKKSKGLVRFDGFAPGQYETIVLDQPENAATLKQNQLFTVEKGKTSKIAYTFGPAGSVKLVFVNPDGSQLSTPRCWGLAPVDAEFFFQGLACGPDQSGAFLTDDVPAGTYGLAIFNQGIPRNTALPKKAVKIVVKAAKVSEVTIQLTSGGQGVVVSTLDPDGAPLNGACISVLSMKDGKPYRQAGYTCPAADEQASGTTTFWGLEPGSYYVQVTSFGQAQYAAPALKKVKISAGKEADVTIQAEIGGILNVSVRYKQKNIDGFCLYASSDIGAFYPQYFQRSCDADDGAKDGRVTFTNVPSGKKISVIASSAPSGWTLPALESVSLESGATGSLKLGSSKGGSQLVLHRVDGNGKSQPGSCFFIYTRREGKAGDFVASSCFSQEANDPAISRIAGLAPGDYVAKEEYNTAGAKPVADTPFTIVKGQDLELTIPAPVVTPSASPVASPVASPIASPVASPIASPTASR